MPPQEIDALKTPLGVLLRHLFLRTPQGWTCLFFGAVTFFAGIVGCMFPAVTAWPPLKNWDFLLIYPLILVMGLLRVGGPHYEPSRFIAGFMAVIGVFPFIYPYIRDVIP